MSFIKLLQQKLVYCLYVFSLFRYVCPYCINVIEQVTKGVLHHIGLSSALVCFRIYNNFYPFMV